jgi:hypothetical protein
MLMLPSAATPAGDVVLKTNPFMTPLETDGNGANKPGVAAVPLPAMELRGIMVAGPYSLADIGGEVLAIGQEIQGYRLVTIQPRHVVLEKNDSRKILSIDKDKEKKP